MDGRPTSLNVIRSLSDGQIVQTNARFIGVIPKNGSTYTSGCVIPVSHFKPMVERLIKRGELNPANVRSTIERLRVIADTLIPFHVAQLPDDYANAIRRHGEYLSPLIAIQTGKGKCTDWAAVFTAMGRAAGLDVRIEGDPQFFKDRPEFGRLERFHVWPVVRVGGQRIPVHSERRIFGSMNEDADRDDATLVKRRIEKGVFRTHQEYVPGKLVEIPEELKVRRPDIFGE